MLYKVFNSSKNHIYLVEATESYFAQKTVREYLSDNSYCGSQILDVNEDISSYIHLTQDILNKGK